MNNNAYDQFDNDLYYVSEPVNNNKIEKESNNIPNIKSSDNNIEINNSGLNCKNDKTCKTGKKMIDLLEDDEFYKPTKTKNENMFIKDLKSSNILKKNKYPNLDYLLELYLNNFTKQLENFNSFSIIIVILIILYFILLIYLLTGWLSPNNILVYHIVSSIIFLILFENENNFNPLNLLLDNIFNKTIYLFSISYETLKNIILVLTFVSFIQLLEPKLSLFSMIKKLILYLDKFN